MNHSTQAGFSLIETLSVTAITAILLSNAIPFIGDYYDQKRLVAAAEMIYGKLQTARSEAIARSKDVYVKFDIDGSDNWSLGTSTVSGCSPTDGLMDVNPCYLVVDNGDGLTTADDRVLQSTSSVDYPGIKITNVTFGGDQAKFDYVRGTAKAGSIKLESANGYRIKVVTGLIGRIRMCSPAGFVHVTGYPEGSCSW